MEKNMNELRAHIRAVCQTRQITNAMYLLSASRMKKTMQNVNYCRNYFYRVQSAVKDILIKSPQIEHPYLNKRPGKRAGYIVIAGDKGMCGAYNHNVLNYAWDCMRQTEGGYLVTVGICATEFFKKKGIAPDYEYIGIAQNPTIGNARSVKDNMFDLYNTGLVDEIYLVYTRFLNTAVQYPRRVRLLPLSISTIIDFPKCKTI